MKHPQKPLTAAVPPQTPPAEKRITPIRLCPFCGEGDIEISAYSEGNAYELGGPLFKWYVKIRCGCCASIDSCLDVQEAIAAWNGSNADFMEEGWDVSEIEANFEALPEAGPDEEEFL